MQEIAELAYNVMVPKFHTPLGVSFGEITTQEIFAFDANLCSRLRPLPFNVSGNLKRELLKSNLVAPELASI